ncbi:hypothetical protein N9Y42_05650 [Mariniblastus sp.]|nr:hypothetical protein [Mariniblastus sp.]
MSELNVKEVLRQAEKHTEHGEYVIAIELLRTTILKTEPRRILLDFLEETERSERIAFRQKLADLYQHSFECKLAWIQMLSNKRNSHRHCCELIKQFSGNTVRQNLLRQMRFQLAIDSHIYSFLCEDFVWLYNLKMNQPKVNKRIRVSLLKRLAQINDPKAITNLQQLSRIEPLDDREAKFLKTKCEELNILSQAL